MAAVVRHTGRELACDCGRIFAPRWAAEASDEDDDAPAPPPVAPLTAARAAWPGVLRDLAAAALDRERRMLLALETGPSAEAFDAPSGAPCLRCGGGAYAVACPLCSLAGDR